MKISRRDFFKLSLGTVSGLLKVRRSQTKNSGSILDNFPKKKTSFSLDVIHGGRVDFISKKNTIMKG